MSAPRTASVVTNLRCNQNYVHYDQQNTTNDPRIIHTDTIQTRITTTLTDGAREIRFTGGEPTLRRDLPALVAAARGGGAETVAIETNAALVDGERATALAAAGLALARVNLAGTSVALDEVTRDPGGFAATCAGIDALLAAGVQVEVVATLIASTRASFAALPAFVASRWPAVRLIEIIVPTTGRAPDELVPFAEAAAAVTALEAAARAAGVSVRMSPGDGIPPCLFPPTARLRHIYSFTAATPPRDGYVHPPACGECLIADRCPGFPAAALARRAPPALSPIREDRDRRRLTLVTSVPEQIARELVSHSARFSNGRPVRDEIVRVNFHCNQACSFCFVSTHLPAAGEDDVEAAIRAAGARGSHIVLSGGEPTLNRRLRDYVQLAREASGEPPTLQTNAIRLDDRALVDALVAAGLGQAFVSLHGATAEISDAITEAPGTFGRTVNGIDNLVAAGIPVVLNFVICAANRAETPAFVRLVAARWPAARINFSFVAASTDLVPRDRRLIPRYSEVLPALADAVADAERLGVTLTGFESMCGLPLCLVPQALDHLHLGDVPAELARGEFLHTDACDACRHRTSCWGIRRGYADLYGTEELRAIPA